jgi:hypothetical protein
MKVIVSTTINPVTEAIERFDRLTDWRLVVIGDRKTPPYRLERGTYVSPEEQEEYDRQLSDAIGWNCIQRRNFGLLWAHDMGADIVAVVDDDNIPYDDWGQNLMVANEVEANYYQTDLPAFDPVGATNEKRIWHRGYPLQLVPRRDYSDAVGRREHAPQCEFDPSLFPIASNQLAPFNSQNTFLSGRLLKDYFLFPHIGRMDDIWASYYLQAKGYKLVYGKPSVFQARNEHDLIKDMKQEYLGYENNLSIVQDLATDPEKIFDYLPERSIRAFDLYRRHFIPDFPK